MCPRKILTKKNQSKNLGTKKYLVLKVGALKNRSSKRFTVRSKSEEVQGKVSIRSGKGKAKVKVMSRQGKIKVKVRSKQDHGNIKRG